jgi:histidyl-tRNA synthetase
MSEDKPQFKAVKGTHDILPPDSALWNWFEQTARNTFESYNFHEIRTPIIERARLFERSVGIDSDIVTKELFSWIDAPRANHALRRLRSLMTETDSKPSDPNSLADHLLIEMTRKEAFDTLSEQGRLVLRPEATASVVRAYIEHGMQSLAGNQKLYYIGPMYRRERPQKGRYRQFYQIGAEVLGQSDAPAIDAELIQMLMAFFKRAGITSTTLYINSIGDRSCRPQYIELLREALRRVADHLGSDSQRRIETNPLRVLDSKLPEEQTVIETLPRISDHLCDACREHFAKLKEELDLRCIAYEEKWRLVRGLDYYTRTTFEVIAEGLGSQNAVCGGGRYDGLVKLLGGPPTKGIGFAIGTDRAILSLQENGKLPPPRALTVFVAWMGAAAYPIAVNISQKLREAALSVELPAREMNFTKSLGLASRLHARYALIIGKNEVASTKFTLKRLADSDQKELSEFDLLEYLESEQRGTRA